MEEATAQGITPCLVELIAALESSEAEAIIQHASRITWQHALREQGVIKLNCGRAAGGAFEQRGVTLGVTEQQDEHRVRACKRSLPKDVPQPMLTLLHHNTHDLPYPFPPLEAILAEPFPCTPQDMMQLEQRLATAAAQTADQILLIQVTRAHEDEAFVKQAIAQARAQR